MLTLLLSIILLSLRLSAPEKPPNVLFIMSEDLRPELPSYGRHAALTPNIQRIADRGLIFDLVTCQVAICAPSRSSM
jgi:iduronate 2-sulfatase